MPDFPEPIKNAMRQSGAAATCVPVQIDSDEWECALFLHVAGPECKQDRRIIKTAGSPVPVRFEAELMTHAKAAVVLLRVQVFTVESDPLAFEILLVPGQVSTQYETLRHLSSQRRIVCFFGDGDYRVIRAQSLEIGEEQHAQMARIAKEAFAHDSVLRMTSQYNADAAVSEICDHYTPRTGVHPGAATH